MKIPLRYQITEYDCGTTSLLNAISYTIDREKIPAKVIQAITTYTQDNFSKKGNELEGGTSLFSLEFLNHWINQYALYEKFPLKMKLLKNDEADLQIDKANKLFAKKGCIFASVWLMKTEHYILITNIDEEYVYIFDPYYVEKEYFKYNKNIVLVDNSPLDYNRKVRLNQLYLKNKEDYSLIKNNQYQELLVVEKI